MVLMPINIDSSGCKSKYLIENNCKLLAGDCLFFTFVACMSMLTPLTNKREIVKKTTHLCTIIYVFEMALSRGLDAFFEGRMIELFIPKG